MFVLFAAVTTLVWAVVAGALLAGLAWLLTRGKSSGRFAYLAWGAGLPVLVWMYVVVCLAAVGGASLVSSEKALPNGWVLASKGFGIGSTVIRRGDVVAVRSVGGLSVEGRLVAGEIVTEDSAKAATEDCFLLDTVTGEVEHFPSQNDVSARLGHTWQWDTVGEFRSKEPGADTKRRWVSMVVLVPSLLGLLVYLGLLIRFALRRA